MSRAFLSDTFGIRATIWGTSQIFRVGDGNRAVRVFIAALSLIVPLATYWTPVPSSLVTQLSILSIKKMYLYKNVYAIAEMSRDVTRLLLIRPRRTVFRVRRAARRYIQERGSRGGIKNEAGLARLTELTGIRSRIWADVRAT